MNLSLTRDDLDNMPLDELAEVVNGIGQHNLQAIAYDWPFWARPDQVMPGNINPRTDDGRWTYWLTLAGRGWGKTRTGAEAVRDWVRQGFTLVNLIGATVDDARDVMIEGESGILAICPPDERPRYLMSKRQLKWPNGAVSLIFTADEPERLRGKQHMKLWADELASWRYPEAWDQAKFGLRLGQYPQAFISTTPRPFKIIKELIADPDCLVTRGTTYDNRSNLAKTFYTSVIKAYEGTRLGRQELEGIVLDDNPNALFKRTDIDAGRVPSMPAGVTIDRFVVAIDPAVTSDEDSDETGIIGAAIGSDGDGYVFDDVSGIFTPNEWARQAIQLYHTRDADRIVAESNNGGEMVESTLHTVDENIPVKLVHASRGKAIRAEPIAALYEQHRIHHVGTLGKLEDQMTDWVPDDKKASSPDRMDALVWALTELMGQSNLGLLQYMRGRKRSSDAAKNDEQKDENRSAEHAAHNLMEALRK